MQHAANAVTDIQNPLFRLNMYIGGPKLDSLKNQVINNFNDGRVLALLSISASLVLPIEGMISSRLLMPPKKKKKTLILDLADFCSSAKPDQ